MINDSWFMAHGSREPGRALGPPREDVGWGGRRPRGPSLASLGHELSFTINNQLINDIMNRIIICHTY